MEHALSLAAWAQEMATIAERKTRAQDQQQHTSHLSQTQAETVWVTGMDQVVRILTTAIGDSGHTEQALAALLLGDGYHLHRRREITPRGQAVPKFVEVVFQLRLKRFDRLSIHSCGAVIGFYLLIGCPYGLFGNTKRLC